MIWAALLQRFKEVIQAVSTVPSSAFNFAWTLNAALPQAEFQAEFEHVLRVSSSTMPSVTQRQQAADALHCAFLVNLVARAEGRLAQDF